MIIFRLITRPRPPEWAHGIHWFVEFYEDDVENSCPSGTAYVVAAPVIQVVEFILVRDDRRRRGVATELLRACYRRWPNIGLTDSVTEAGAAFLAALRQASAGREPEGPAHG